ncbi:sigma factor-like helix-turn-helix DNA-binding protein [Ralstonia sp. Ralssp135]|uniref:sigma factor-like helix-turn-helix DNA-binding protein n=1 Tax=Ralstonia sp. Ralssp135 TaxID=3243016 RepID=UPI0039B080E7
MNTQNRAHDAQSHTETMSRLMALAADQGYLVHSDIADALPADTLSIEGLQDDTLPMLLAVPREPLSLDSPVAEGDTQIVELIEDHASPDPFGVRVNARMREFVESLLGSMTPIDAMVLRLRFGIGGGGQYSHEEVARQTGMTTAQVRRAERQALQALRSSAQTSAATWTFLVAED